eukprot:5212738-Pyramimonas_sp.AAC.1
MRVGRTCERCKTTSGRMGSCGGRGCTSNHTSWIAGAKFMLSGKEIVKAHVKYGGFEGIGTLL